jgi:hypothetical protein
VPAAKHIATVKNGSGNGHVHATQEPVATAKRRDEIPLEGDFKDF